MRIVPNEISFVGNRYGQLRSEDAVVFNDDDYRIDHLEFLPNPVVVPIDVDTENSDRAAPTCLTNQIVDIVASDPGLFGGQGVTPVDFVALDLIDTFLTAIQNQAAPVVVQE